MSGTLDKINNHTQGAYLTFDVVMKMLSDPGKDGLPVTFSEGPGKNRRGLQTDKAARHALSPLTISNSRFKQISHLETNLTSKRKTTDMHMIVDARAPDSTTKVLTISPDIIPGVFLSGSQVLDDFDGRSSLTRE